jgi:hypothetical protein
VRLEPDDGAPLQSLAEAIEGRDARGVFFSGLPGTGLGFSGTTSLS